MLSALVSDAYLARSRPAYPILFFLLSINCTLSTLLLFFHGKLVLLSSLSDKVFDTVSLSNQPIAVPRPSSSTLVLIGANLHPPTYELTIAAAATVEFKEPAFASTSVCFGSQISL